MSTDLVLNRTQLFEIGKKYGAKMIDFGVGNCQLQFSHIYEEHETVRQK